MGGETLSSGGTVLVAVSLLRAAQTPPVNVSPDYMAQWSSTTGWLKKKFSLPRTGKEEEADGMWRMICFHSMTVWEQAARCQSGNSLYRPVTETTGKQRRNSITGSVCSSRTQHGSQSSQQSCSPSAGDDRLCGFRPLWPHGTCTFKDYALNSCNILAFIIVLMTESLWVTSPIKGFLTIDMLLQKHSELY